MFAGASPLHPAQNVLTKLSVIYQALIDQLFPFPIILSGKTEASMISKEQFFRDFSLKFLNYPKKHTIYPRFRTEAIFVI